MKSPDHLAVTVQPQGWTFEATDSMSLLEAAQLSGIVLPSSCRNGTCRTCMCRLLAGHVKYRIEWPGLSAEEKREGFILPCVACPRTDVVIEAPGAELERFDDQCKGSAVLLGGGCRAQEICFSRVADARQGTTGSPAALSPLGALHSPPSNAADRFATLALIVKPL